MAEHTPTTETVRDCFVGGAEGDFIEEDFDRWLAEVRREAAVEAGVCEHQNANYLRMMSERDELRAEVERLRAGVEAAVVTLNREVYRQPTPWIDRLANRLCALLARGEGS